MSSIVMLIGSEPQKMIRLRRTYQSLKRMGIKVSVLIPYDKPRSHPRVVSGIIRYLLITLQVVKNKADVYHFYNIPDIIGLPLLFKRGKVIYDVRSPWSSSVRESKFTGSRIFSVFAKLIEYLMTRSVDLVLTANYPLAKRARCWGARRVIMVPNYPPADFGPNKTRDEMRKELGLGDSPTLLYLGKISVLEGSELLKQIILTTSQKLPNLKFLVVGDGPQKQSLEKFLQKHKIKERVIMTGWVSHSDVPNFIITADLCLFPRNWTTFSKYTAPENILKIGEYLALGKPVIAPRMGGFVEAEFPVIAVEPSKMANAILDFFRNPKPVEKFQRPTWDISHKKLERIYRNLGF